MTDLFDTRGAGEVGKGKGDDPDNPLLRQYQLRKQTDALQKQHDRDNADFGDWMSEAGKSLVYRGIQDPFRSVGQWIDGEDSKTHDAERALTFMEPLEEAPFGHRLYYAQQFGGGLGLSIPYGLTLLTMKKTGISLIAKTEATVASTGRLFSAANGIKLIDTGIAGFGTDFLLRPVEEGEGKHLLARTKHGAVGAGTLMTMTAGSLGLRHMTSGLAADYLMGTGVTQAVGRKVYDGTVGIMSGAPAGVVSADLHALTTELRMATWEERGKGAYTMAWTGGLLSVTHLVPREKSPMDFVIAERNRRNPGKTSLEGLIADNEVTRTAKARLDAAALPGGAKAREAQVTGTTEGKVGQPIIKRIGSDSKGGGSAAEALLAGRAFASGDKLPGEGPTGKAKVEGEANSHGTPKEVADKSVPGEKTVPAEKTGAETVKPVEGTIPRKDIPTQVPTELIPVFKEGAQKAFDASDPAASHQQVVEFFRYAQNEGRELRDFHLKLAEDYGDPRMVTIIREAYMPRDGVEHRIIDGDIQVKNGKPLTDPQVKAWVEFMGMVQNMPHDLNGYTRFRHDVFRWLNENPELQDMARQYGEQNRFSKVAGPLDFYFGTSNMKRFQEVADGLRPADESPSARGVTADRNDGTATLRQEGGGERKVDDGTGERKVEGDGEATGPKIRLDMTAKEAEAGRIRKEGEGDAETPIDLLGARQDPLQREIDLATGLPKELVNGDGVAKTEGVAKNLTDAVPKDLTEGVPRDVKIEGGEKPAPDAADGLPVKKLITVGERTLEQTIAEPLTPAAKQQQAFEARFNGFEKSTGTLRKVEAKLLSDHFGRMSTEQFAKWLDYAYAPVEGATAGGATNLSAMRIPHIEILNSKEVRDALDYHKNPSGKEKPEITLDQVRELVGAPKGEAGPMPKWLNDFVGERIAESQILSEGKPPHEVLDNAIPRWLQERIKAEYGTPGKLGDPMKYSEQLPPEFKTLMEQADATRPKPKADQRERKPFPNDLNFRLDMMQQLMAIKDPVLRERLTELGKQDQMALKTVMGKLNPERAHPEYVDLLKMTLPNAKSIKDVQTLLDAIFFANKSQRMDRESAQTKSNTEMALAAAENLVPQSDANYQATQKLVLDFIEGRKRDPMPPRDGDGGKPGFGPRGQNDRFGGRDRGRQHEDDGGSKKSMTPGAARPEIGTTIKRGPLGGEKADKLELAEQNGGDRDGGAVKNDVVVDQTGGGAKKDVVGDGDTANGAGQRTVAEPVPDGGSTKLNEPVTDPAALRSEPAPEVVTKQAEREIAKPVEEAPIVDNSSPRDLSTLRGGAKVKVSGKDAIFVAVDPVTSDAVIRTGKGLDSSPTFKNEKAFGKMKLAEVGRENGNNIYRDPKGMFYFVQQHGSGYMVTPRLEYRSVNPSEVK